MTIADQILYEDNHLIALNKQPGQIVQGDKTGDPCLAEEIKAFLKVRDAKPGNVFCGVIHRLDRPVSGVVVFAKTGKALSRMNAMVKDRSFKKQYWALVKNMPPQSEGHLEDYLVRNEQQNKSYVVENKERTGAKLASLDYRLIPSNTVPIGTHGMPHQRRFEVWCTPLQPRREHLASCLQGGV